MRVFDDDLGNNVASLTGAIEKVFRYNPKKVKKFSFEDLIEHIHPEDRELVLEKFMQAKKLGERDHV